MRVLVQGGTLSRDDPRMCLAAYGLALRGHAVFWLGGGCPGPAVTTTVPAGAADSLALSETDEHWPPAPRLVSGGLKAPRIRADVVIGGGRAPSGAAVAGWLSGARAMVLGLDERRARRWN